MSGNILVVDDSATIRRMIRKTMDIVASTDGSKQRIQQMVELEACASVRKPFQPEQLRDALMRPLGVNENAGTNTGDGGDNFF